MIIFAISSIICFPSSWSKYIERWIYKQTTALNSVTEVCIIGRQNKHGQKQVIQQYNKCEL
jgi:hypothetical protein